MFFYDEARVDGLVKRVETPTEMTEHYKNRDDFLYYKHVDFGKKPKKFGPQDGSSSAHVRPILVSSLNLFRFVTLLPLNLDKIS